MPPIMIRVVAALNPNGGGHQARTRRAGMIKGSDFLPVPAEGEAPQVTRFAPSPSGYLHLGHAYSALFGYDAARYSGGRFLLRIEDIDRQRSRPEFEQGIYDDLHWLGIGWE